MKTVKPKAQEKVTRAQIEEQQERLRQEARAGLEFFIYFHNTYIICLLCLSLCCVFCLCFCLMATMLGEKNEPVHDLKNETVHEKTNNLCYDLDQVRHKPSCAITEEG